MNTSDLEHLSIAEQGKRAALAGEHRQALACYGRAMKLAVLVQAPEVFFRHYLEATLESLELMGESNDVLAYCDKALEHYALHPPPNQLALFDLANIHQRRGVILLKLSRVKDARVSLEESLRSAEAAGGQLELARLLLGWIRKGLTVTSERILKEQHRLRYFSVRSESLRMPTVTPTAETPLGTT